MNKIRIKILLNIKLNVLFEQNLRSEKDGCVWTFMEKNVWGVEGMGRSLEGRGTLWPGKESGIWLTRKDK